MPDSQEPPSLRDVAEKMGLEVEVTGSSQPYPGVAQRVRTQDPALPDLVSRCAKLSDDLHDLLRDLSDAAPARSYYGLAHDILVQSAHNVRFAYRAAAAAKSLEVLKDVKANQAKATEGFNQLLVEAVVCENSREFVGQLVDAAKEAGFTEDGRTLTPAGEQARKDAPDV